VCDAVRFYIDDVLAWEQFRKWLSTNSLSDYELHFSAHHTSVIITFTKEVIFVDRKEYDDQLEVVDELPFNSQIKSPEPEAQDGTNVD